MRRIGQFWRHASARVTPQENANAERILGPLAPFFLELPVNDQRHGLDVLETVIQLERQPSPLLQQAALLHDLGKVALDAMLPKSFSRVVEAADMLRGNIADLERTIIGLDHMVVGKRLAEKWQLPATVRDCVAMKDRIVMPQRVVAVMISKGAFGPTLMR